MDPTETNPTQHPRKRPPGSDREIDREINLRAVSATVFGIFALTAVCMVLMWVMFEVLLKDEQRADPAPSPLAAANQPVLPPGPRLQASPEAEMERFRAEENRQLASYGWKNRDEGVVRIPVSRAMEVLATQGRDAMSMQPDPTAGDDTAGDAAAGDAMTTDGTDGSGAGGDAAAGASAAPDSGAP
jgi:hypothetical protein